MAAADSDARFALIKENLAEVLNEEIIKKILDEGRHPKIYWGAWCARYKRLLFGVLDVSNTSD